MAHIIFKVDVFLAVSGRLSELPFDMPHAEIRRLYQNSKYDLNFHKIKNSFQKRSSRTHLIGFESANRTIITIV